MAGSGLQEINKATLEPSVIKANGAGKAYQSVAQSMAIAIQDATDYLRNIGSISATGIGVAVAKLIETQNLEYIPIIEECQKIMTVAEQDFKTIGQNAADILKAFPSS